MNNRTEDMMKTAYQALTDKKAPDVRVLDISQISPFTDYFIITNGNSASHVDALIDHVKERMHGKGYALRQQEGGHNGSWILLDYGDVIIHVFDRESRSFYQLERIWNDGKVVEPDEATGPDTAEES